MSRFDIGKEVYVKDSGSCYSGFIKFFKENGLDILQDDYVSGEVIPIDDMYTVVAKGKHPWGNTVLVLQNSDGQVYLMGKDKHYIKKAWEEF